MSNENVIRKFLEHEQAHTPMRTTVTGIKTPTLWTWENTLINYQTIIAKWEDGHVKLNVKRYSQTTSKIQHMIERICEEKNIEVEPM